MLHYIQNNNKQLSEKAELILELRESAKKEQNYELFLGLDNIYRQIIKTEHDQEMLSKLDDELDERERNLALKHLKKDFNPTPYTRKRKHGQPIPPPSNS